MGNCLGKADNDNDNNRSNFGGLGQVVGNSNQSSNQQTASTPAPAKKQSTPGGSPQAVRVSSGQASGSPAALAGKAAETRAQAARSKPKGVIGQKLDADRKRTMSSTLQAMSADERRRRDADAAAAARTHN